METRSRNANVHPGLVDAKAKRVRSDGPTQKEVAAQKKVDKKVKHDNAVSTIAVLENQMAKDAVNDETPRAKPARVASRQLGRTESYVNIPLTMDDDVVDDSEDNMDVDVADNHTQGPAASTDRNFSDDDASSEPEAPPKKKRRPVKTSIRDSIKDFIDKDKKDMAPEGRRPERADGSVTMVSETITNLEHN